MYSHVFVKLLGRWSKKKKILLLSELFGLHQLDMWEIFTFVHS